MLRELKLRGRVKRILVVAPKGLVRQWQAEMRLHFGESSSSSNRPSWRPSASGAAAAQARKRTCGACTTR